MDDRDEQTDRAAEAAADDEVVVEDVDWHVDDDGTEYFIEDGVRYDLAADGYAYPAPDPVPDPVADPDPGADAPSWPESAPAEPLSPFSREASITTSEVPVVQVSEADLWGEADGATALRDRPDETAPPTGEALLQLSGVSSGYGALPVLHGVDMRIRAGETAVLLGLNGAGKTTTAMNICGALGTWGGTITFDGRDITSWSTRKAVDAGIVMVPEGRRVFPDLSVAKNLQMGAWSRRKDGDALATQRERVFDYFPRLRERTGQLAGTLSGGEQQMLAIGRGLMARPKLLIIDEASMGLAPVIVKDVFEIVADIASDGVTVLLIEQNVGALDVADVGYVMEQGRMVRDLRGDDLRDRAQVSEALMG